MASAILLDLDGTMLCARHVVPEIIKAGGGTVINMSSGAALRGGSPLHIYTSAKGAILALSFCAAVLHQPETATDTRFASGPARVAHRRGACRSCASAR